MLFKGKKYPSYVYVGSEQIWQETDFTIGGTKIHSPSDIRDWIEKRREEIYHRMITATFIINEKGDFVVSGRHTEHVMCAQGQNVLSAGEVVFALDGREVYITEISNQSTGYCPRPTSWPIVDYVLRNLGIDYPAYFTSAFEFRYCTHCENINLIKDNLFQCGVCSADLDLEWNFDQKTGKEK